MEERISLDELVDMQKAHLGIKELFDEAWDGKAETIAEQPLEFADRAAVEDSLSELAFNWPTSPETPVTTYLQEEPQEAAGFSLKDLWHGIQEARNQRKETNRPRLRRWVTVGALAVSAVASGWLGLSKLGVNEQSVQTVAADYNQAEVSETVATTTTSTTVTEAPLLVDLSQPTIQVGDITFTQQEARDVINLSVLVAQGNTPEQVQQTLDYAVYVQNSGAIS